ncbi:MAG: hypothetical protein HC836_46125 [Richelia sp. RM2_1_2]|nr:hypothetical protein [Richelia sp. RM2_1_2]
MSNKQMNIIKRLNDNESLLDVMIQIEDYLDSVDIYAFANWMDGELVSGPYVKKYWIIITLKYPHQQMPDPDGGLRLMKYGSMVKFEKAFEEVPVEVDDPSEDLDPNTGRPKLKKEPIWLIHLKIPRKFVEALNIEGLDLFDGETEELEQITAPTTETLADENNAPAEIEV